MKYLFFFLLLFTSCLKPNFSLEEKLSLAKNIELNAKYLNLDNITNPKNTWVEVFKFDNWCAFYKTPYNKKMGVFRVVEKSSQKCHFDADGLFEKHDISSFKYTLLTKNKTTLRIQINTENTDYRLFNYRMDKKKFNAFDNQLKSSFFGNVFVNGGLDSLKDKTLNDGQLCHGVNIECQDVVANKCDQCLHGSYEVVDFNCTQGGSKYCGQNKCGEKNQPACPRGYKVLDSKLPTLCFNGSPAGFCKPGLKTFCNDDGILVCL